MVPVDGSHASMEAVGLACDIARRNKGKVYVVHVIEVKRTLALDAPMDVEETAGDEMLAASEITAKDHGYEVDGEILHAREAASAIVDEAIERAADLIIMGIEYQQPVGEFVLGKAVESVLKNAACEVWVLRHAVEATA
jgi:nucleotide-binding universal stress UspA family protein